MKNLTILLIIIINFSLAKAQFIQNTTQSLYSDVKAFKSGDAIMVLITEATSADNSATTSNDRNMSLGASLGLGSSNLSGALGTTHSFKGSGSTGRSENITSKLSARVVNVEPNGNLQIEGKRTTKINGEIQTITIKGIVRLVDILSNNSIYSYNIMDLTLMIEGDGTVTKTQEPGLITKFLRILF